MNKYRHFSRNQLLTHDQTLHIFETNTIGVTNQSINVDDVIETANHFRCIDMVINRASSALSEKFIKELHLTLKTGTIDSRKVWFAVGDYKHIPNVVGGRVTTLSEDVLLSRTGRMEQRTQLPAGYLPDRTGSLQAISGLFPN